MRNGQKKNVAGIEFIMSKKVMSRIHPIANSTVRKHVFLILEHKVKTMRYDELAMIYANNMVKEYKNTRYFEMLRSRLRLIGRLLLSLKQLQTNIAKVASIFDP